MSAPRPPAYILKDGEPVPCDDPDVWRLSMTPQQRIVAVDPVGDQIVSTLFIGFDHGPGDGSPPLVFQTSIFDQDKIEVRERTATWDEAEAAHARAVASVRGQL